MSGRYSLRCKITAATPGRGRAGSTPHRVKVAFVILAVVVASSLGACLFDTRTPHQPDKTGTSVALDSPERVFEAVGKALSSLREADYERALSQSFVFSPLLDDSLDQNFVGTTAFTGWTKQVELSVLAVLLSESQPITVKWSPSIEVTTTDFVRFRAGYTLTVPSRVSGQTTVYGGSSQIDVRNEGGNWRIVRWEDRAATDSTATWGFLRGTLRLRVNP